MKLSLKGQDFRVLSYILSAIEKNNILQINKSELAEQLRMYMTMVAASMKTLEQLGLIRSLENDKFVWKVQLSPYIAWNGTATARKEVVKEFKEINKV